VESTGTGMGAAVGASMGFGLLLLMIVVNGLLVGALARWLLPGPDPMSYPKTFLFGLGGSFIGGVIGRLVGGSNWISLILGVLGAMALIWFFRRRKATPPA
jgi:uncharacterized membrane protein YeaQ/YmgE (transglycosylase-associated protein family)